MNVLVTGGTGFVGRYLVRELNARGEYCRLLIRPGSDTGWIAGMKNIETWPGDITSPESLTGIAEGVDIVYHLAAEGHVSAVSDDAFKKFTQINVEGTKHLIAECAGHNIKKLIHFSSTAAMGLIRKKLVDEADTPQPVTPYQKSKLQSETTARKMGKEFGVPVIIVRPCMIYGVNGKGEFYKMSRLMRKGLFPRVGLGKNLTPMVHVRDVVHGAIKAAEKGIPGEVYLLCSERSISLNDLRNRIMEAWGTKALYPYVPVWLMYCLAYCFEVIARLKGTAPVVTRRNIASTVWDREFSIDKARTELGYNPQVRCKDGISETVGWFKQLI